MSLRVQRQTHTTSTEAHHSSSITLVLLLFSFHLFCIIFFLDVQPAAEHPRRFSVFAGAWWILWFYIIVPVFVIISVFEYKEVTLGFGLFISSVTLLNVGIKYCIAFWQLSCAARFPQSPVGDSLLGPYITSLFPVVFRCCSDIVRLMYRSFKHPCSRWDAAAVMLFPIDQLATEKRGISRSHCRVCGAALWSVEDAPGTFLQCLCLLCVASFYVL